MTLDLKPEIATGLSEIATSRGLSVEDYLEQVVERELSAFFDQSQSAQDSGMVWENGLFVYGAGTALPDHVVDDAINRSHQKEQLTGELLAHDDNRRVAQVL